REVVVARSVLARVGVYRLDRAPVCRNAQRVRRGADGDDGLETVGGGFDALLHVRRRIPGWERARREADSGGSRSGQAVDAKGPPVLAASIPRDQVPAAAALEQRVGLGLAAA